MEIGKAYKVGRDMIAKVLTGAITSSVVWVKGPLAFACRKAIIWVLDTCAKPLYDFFERKVATASQKKDVDQKIDAVKNAKTEAEIDAAVDNMP